MHIYTVLCRLADPELGVTFMTFSVSVLSPAYVLEGVEKQIFQSYLLQVQPCFVTYKMGKGKK